MAMHSLRYLLLAVLAAASVSTWDVDFVSERIVAPLVNMSQQLLYCVCDNCQDQRLDKLLRRVQEVNMYPQLVLTQKVNFKVQGGDHKRVQYTIVWARTAEDPIFEIQASVLRGRRFYMHLVVLFEPIVDFAAVERVLRKLQCDKFFNTNVYYRNATSGRNELFGFAYYPEYAVENRTEQSLDLYKVVRSRLKTRLNLQGFVVVSPIQQDAPKVVMYSNSVGQLAAKGTSYSILELFVNYLNGTLRPYGGYGVEVVNMKCVLDMVRTRQVELAAHAYALFESDSAIEKSYPLLVVGWCLMVPIRHSVTTWFYPLLPFDGTVWLVVVFCFLLFHLVVCRWRRHYRVSVGSDLLQTFCQYLNISPPVAIRTGTWLHMLTNACYYAYAFFLSAFYTSVLGSLLTVTLFYVQINSMADLIALQLPVMIIDYELEFFRHASESVPPAFMKLLRPTNSTDFMRHQFAYDTTYAYFVTYDTWHFLQRQQQFFRKRIFKLSNICFGDYHQAFPMEPDSPLWRELEYFLYRVHSSGLHYYFESKAFEYAVHAGLLKRLIDPHGFETVGMQHLRVVFLCHAVNLLLVVLIFMGECIVHRYGQRRRREN